MKFTFGIVLALFFITTLTYSDDLKLENEFEGGKLYKAGQLNVVVMKGNFYQMGRQYGALLKKDLAEFYDLGAAKAGIGTQRFPYAQVVAEMKAALKKQPFYIREWIRGTAETSGLGMEKQTIVSQLLVPIVMGQGGCSGLMVWGKYAKDGATVIGRNWDLPGNALMPFQKFLTVSVFNPVGSAQGVADINYLGQITWQSAMNQSGLFYDLQNGGMSDPVTAKNRMDSNSALMSMMLDSTSLEQVDAFFDAVRANSGLIINVADGNQGMCYEWGTSNYERRVDDESGVLSASNHFMAASWHVFREIPDGQNAGFSRERCANLLALAKKDEGKIDAHQMMDFFDLSIPKGGPSFHSESGFTTYYTIVAVPKELKIWINVRNFQGWKQVDLQPLFD